MAIIDKTIGNPINVDELTTYTPNELYDNNFPLFGLQMGKVYGVPSDSPQAARDFRQVIRSRISSGNDPIFKQKALNILSTSLPYTEGTGPSKYVIERRLNLGDPGNPIGKNLSSYVNGHDGSGAASPNSWDKINAAGLNGNSSFNKSYQDLVKFGIGVYGGGKFLNFRAFLNQISDNYTSDWQDLRYVGRAEKFYTYTGFDRKISLSWTVAAQSKIELMPMYQKLSYLASMCAPDYTSEGYMQGTILTLTIGGYIQNQPGIVTGFSFEMNDDNATWEIALSEEAVESDGIISEDKKVKELPHLIKVTGFNFIPIHKFVPKIGENFIVP